MKPKLYVAIGPSGSGKSTYFNKLKEKNPSLQHYSWDALRHEFYHPTDYKAAFDASTQDKEFMNRVNDRFHKMLEQQQDMFIDNINGSPKRRKYFIDAAKRAGYTTVAIVFNVPLETLIARQTTRGDKNVPEAAVRQQYNSMVRPLPGEFDEVVKA